MKAVIIDMIKTLWRLFKGKTHYRFAAILVRGGVVLLAAPSLFIVIINQVIIKHTDLDIEPISNDFLWTALISVLLFLSAIIIFERGEAREAQRNLDPAPDQVNFTIIDGWSFQDTAQAIVKDSKFSVEFHNFSLELMDTEMREKEITVSNEAAALQAIRLHTKNRDFPTYSISQKDQILTLEKTDG